MDNDLDEAHANADADRRISRGCHLLSERLTHAAHKTGSGMAADASMVIQYGSPDWMKIQITGRDFFWVSLNAMMADDETE